jgi:predicted PurR-regulated permease PerM
VKSPVAVKSVPDNKLEPPVDPGESRSRVVGRKETASTYFLLALAAIALYFSYLTARPFLSPVFLAVMIAIVFHPVHERIQARVRGRNAAALFSTILVLVVLIVSAMALGVVVSKEVRGLVPVAERKKRGTRWLESIRDACDGSSSQLGGKIHGPLQD